MRDIELVRPRAMAACAVAAVLLAAGCGGTGDSSDATPVAQPTTIADEPTEPVDPWTLPLDERPPLFDACEEIPQELAEEVGIADPGVRPVKDINRPGDLISCVWSTSAHLFGITGTWKSRVEYEQDEKWESKSEVVFDEIDGLILGGESVFNNCAVALFSARGSIFINISRQFGSSIDAYRERENDCDVLIQHVDGLAKALPGGS